MSIDTNPRSAAVVPVPTDVHPSGYAYAANSKAACIDHTGREVYDALSDNHFPGGWHFESHAPTNGVRTTQRLYTVTNTHG